ncbi:MAG: ester cyclase, partial [Nitrososphaera sp.]
ILISIVMEKNYIGRPKNIEEEQNKAMIHQYFELHNQKDLQKIEKLVSSKHRFYFSGMPPMDWNGHKEFLTSMFNAFPDLHFAIEDILAEGDKVAFRLALTGTHKGAFQGIPPTGKKISFGGTAIGTIVDGKLEENRVHADIMGLMQQLGAIPAPANAT